MLVLVPQAKRSEKASHPFIVDLSFRRRSSNSTCLQQIRSKMRMNPNLTVLHLSAFCRLAHPLEGFRCWNSRRKRYQRIHSQCSGATRCPGHIDMGSDGNHSSTDQSEHCIEQRRRWDGSRRPHDGHDSRISECVQLSYNDIIDDQRQSSRKPEHRWDQTGSLRQRSR